jgi:hypothetical protein
MTEAECLELVYRLIADSTDGMTEEEIQRIVDWVHIVRSDSMVLKLFYAGKVRLYWPDGGELMIGLREKA